MQSESVVGLLLLGSSVQHVVQVVLKYLLQLESVGHLEVCS